jgi:hypothetical protein
MGSGHVERRAGDLCLAFGVGILAAGLVSIAPDSRTDLDPFGYTLVAVASLALALRRQAPVPVLLVVTTCVAGYQMLGYPGLAAGLPTLSWTAARDVTASVCPPRAVYVHTPLGWQIGLPGDRPGQLARLTAVLRAGIAITEPGSITQVPYEYPTGSVGIPEHLWHPDLKDWEDIEYQSGYRTERTRHDTVAWPGPRAR